MIGWSSHRKDCRRKRKLYRDRLTCWIRIWQIKFNSFLMSGKNRYLFYFIFHICNVWYDEIILILCLLWIFSSRPILMLVLFWMRIFFILFKVCQKFRSSKSLGRTNRWKWTSAKHFGSPEENKCWTDQEDWSIHWKTPWCKNSQVVELEKL